MGALFVMTQVTVAACFVITQEAVAACFVMTQVAVAACIVMTQVAVAACFVMTLVALAACFVMTQVPVAEMSYSLNFTESYHVKQEIGIVLTHFHIQGRGRTFYSIISNNIYFGFSSNTI